MGGEEAFTCGRITLARSVLLFIPNYFMYTVNIPVSVCMKIEKLLEVLFEEFLMRTEEYLCCLGTRFVNLLVVVVWGFDV